jgi:hypothetical protein
MPFPSVTFGQFLEVATKQELEQFAALLQGYLSVEHDENGHHTDLTAESATLTGDLVVAGNGTFGTTVEVGDQALVGSNRPGAGIDMEVSSDSHWRIIAFDSSPIAPSRELNFIDRLDTGQTCAIKFYYDPGNTRYVIGPGSGITLQIGDGTLGRIADIISSGGLYERSRSVALGTYSTFTPALAFGGGSTGLTYASRAGHITRVGDFAVAEISIALSAKGSSTGTATVTGLTANAAANTVGDLDCATGMVGLTGAPRIVLAASGSTLTFVQTTATGRSALDDTHFSDTSDVRINILYRV